MNNPASSSDSRLLDIGARGVFVTAVAIAAAVEYLVRRIGTLRIRESEKRAAAVSHLRGRIVRQTMEKLGATFIKLGQVMSTRVDLFAPPFIEELRKLQDELPAFGFDAVRRTIEEDLGAPLERHFAEFDTLPVAAASVAQVHRARLHDGTEVAVKVLRPDVRRKVEQDAAILLAGARLLALLPVVKQSDPIGHLQEFVNGIASQTDLTIEADHYRRFRANFAGVEGIVFPKVYPEQCSSRILTMDFVRGAKIDRLPPGDHTRAADLVNRMFFKMIYDDGFLHADLHPGNMVLTPEGCLAIFDVGLSIHLDDALFEEFLDLSRCLAMGSTDDVVAHMRRFHVYLGDVDWNAVQADVEAFNTYFRSRSVAELELGEMFNRMFALGRKYCIRPVTRLTLMIVGFVTAEGISKMLNPSMNSFEVATAYLAGVFERRAAAGGVRIVADADR